MVNTQCYKQLGQNLRSLRESLGQSVQFFATDCGCSAYTIQSYELGRKGPNFKRFIEICNAKGISPNQLLAGLSSTKTELLAVSGLQKIFDEMTPLERRRISSAFDVIIKCMMDTAPSLAGAGFGTRLHLLRLDSGLDTRELADKCMIAKSTLQGYESGQYDPSIPVLVQLCGALGVSPEYMLAGNLEKTSFPDQRLIYLRPQQIIALHKAAQYLKSSM